MLMTHYAIMNEQEECVKRLMPIGVLVYHMYLKTVHSGMTANNVLAMDDERFSQFYGQGLQITCDAALVPYQKDFVPGLALSFTEGFTLAAVGTEDMVRGWGHFMLFHAYRLTFFSCRDVRWGSRRSTGEPSEMWEGSVSINP